MSCESIFRPAGVIPPFFRADLPTAVRFRFAHRAFAAAESFALVAANIPFSPVLNAIKLCREVKRNVFPEYRSGGESKGFLPPI